MIQSGWGSNTYSIGKISKIVSVSTMVIAQRFWNFKIIVQNKKNYLQKPKYVIKYNCNKNLYKIASAGGNIMNIYLPSVPVLVSGSCSVQG